MPACPHSLFPIPSCIFAFPLHFYTVLRSPTQAHSNFVCPIALCWHGILSAFDMCSSIHPSCKVLPFSFLLNSLLPPFSPSNSKFFFIAHTHTHINVGRQTLPFYICISATRQHGSGRDLVLLAFSSYSFAFFSFHLGRVCVLSLYTCLLHFTAIPPPPSPAILDIILFFLYLSLLFFFSLCLLLLLYSVPTLPQAALFHTLGRLPCVSALPPPHYLCLPTHHHCLPYKT